MNEYRSEFADYEEKLRLSRERAIDHAGLPDEPEEPKDIDPVSLPGMDWGNDSLFFTHEYEDETSQFDPLGRWACGSDCYMRTFRCRVPLAFRECKPLIDWFIERMIDDNEQTGGFWL